MAKRRSIEVPKPVRKPDVSVSTGTSRSKAITLNQPTARDRQASRSILEAVTPPSRSKAISAISVPSSTSRNKSISPIGTTPRSKSRVVEPITSNTHRSFFSKKDIVGGESRQRPSVEPISSGVTRSKNGVGSITPNQSRSVDDRQSIQGGKTLSSVGGGPIIKSKSRPRPLRVSDL